MKKLMMLLTALLLVFSLVGCQDVCVGPECIIDSGDNTADDGNDDASDDNGEVNADYILKFDHLNGHGDIQEQNLFVLFEWEVRDYVKYQITYLSCTCRNPDVNYWQVAYVEVNKYTNDLRTISFGQDGEDGHYTAGMWGDSSPTPTGKTLEDFENEFIPWLEGQSLETLDGINVFSNGVMYDKFENTQTIDNQELIDSYAGSSVTTNNMIRAMKTLLTYHEENYDE